MRFLLSSGQELCRKIIVLALVTLLNLSGLFILFNTPSLAIPDSPYQLTNEDKIERAYDAYGADSGIREEIYQERLKSGQNPEQMPKPFKRIKDLNNKEVPETSLLETTVSKVRELVGDTNDK